MKMLKKRTLVTFNPITYSERGFTFIELIIYISIVAVLMVALVNFTIIINQMYAKGRIRESVNFTVRYSSERLKYEIRSCAGIVDAASDFDVNLADNEQYRLTLITKEGTGNTVFKAVNGVLMVSVNGSQYTGISDTNNHITSLVFANNSSLDGKTNNISFMITAEYAADGNSKVYKNRLSARSSAEIRYRE